MSYRPHNFETGQKLYAYQLDEIEEQIISNESEIIGLKEKLDGDGIPTKEDLLDVVNQYFAENPPSGVVTDTTLSATSTNPVQNKVIKAEIDALKKSVSDGKTLLADAITQKGVSTASGDSFSTMASNISAIVSGETVEDVIIDNPKYFQSEVGKIIQNISGKSDDKLLIFHITDSHIYTSNNNKQYFDQQMASMLAVAKAVKPDLVVHGGDMTNGSESKAVTMAESLDVVKQMREVGGDNTLILIGNHDGNYVSTSQASTEMITEAEMLANYRYWDDGFTYPIGKLYGYRDYPSKGIRVIRMHSYMGDGTLGGTGANWGYPSDEVTWFRDVALNTNLDILLLSHQTLSPVLQGYDESQDIPHNGMQIQTLIDNWQTSNRKCIGVLHGHVHWDYVSKGKGTFTVIDHNSKAEMQRVGTHGNFYEYGMGLANYQTNYSTKSETPTSSYRDVPKGAVSVGRTAGTSTQALWSVIVVDKSNTRFSVYRFGAGGISHYNYAEESLMITSESSDLTIEEGTAFTFEVIVNKVIDTEYQWMVYNPAVGQWIDPATMGLNSTSFSIGLYAEYVTADLNGTKWKCTVTNGDETVTSREILLTVTAKPQKVNVLTQAVDSNENPYNNGQGWKSGYRLSSSGGESVASDMFVTGFIPVTKGQKLTFENIHLDAVNTANCYINVYNSSKTLIKANYAKDWVYVSADGATKTSDGLWVESLYLNAGVSNADISATAYIRLSAKYIGSDSAVYIE